MIKMEFRFWDFEKKKMLYSLPDETEEKVEHGDFYVYLTLKYVLTYRYGEWLKVKKIVTGVTVSCGAKYLSNGAIESFEADYLGEEYDVGWKIMQYIGLKDKNDKKIFEGDIILVRYVDDFGEILWEDAGVVVFIDVFKGFAVVGIGGLEIYSFEALESEEAFEWESIGNVFENSELVEKYNLNPVVKKFFTTGDK